jgi:hypothetical protein
MLPVRLLRFLRSFLQENIYVKQPSLLIVYIKVGFFLNHYLPVWNFF